ncbi:MAG: hypothetical protein CM15mP128_2220 [Methanobacteriota archaeon]|nr:MAG: hypothetical protein CM15mP128_2220 [Euryarchaeota archaeon]
MLAMQRPGSRKTSQWFLDLPKLKNLGLWPDTIDFPDTFPCCRRAGVARKGGNRLPQIENDPAESAVYNPSDTLFGVPF